MASLDFWEVKGYPKEHRDRRSFRATRKLLVAWLDRFLLRELLIRHPGHRYPYISGFAARAISVGMEPIGKQEQVGGAYPDGAKYGWALLTVEYRTPQYGEAQPFPKDLDPVLHEIASAAISEQLEPNAEARRLDHSKFQWGDGTPLAADEAPVDILRRSVYRFTRHNLPAWAVPDTSNLEWSTNLNPITPITLPNSGTFAPGTLLFEPPETDYATGEDGELLWDVTYRFNFKAEGWWNFWRADSQAYDKIKVVASGLDYENPPKRDWSVVFPHIEAEA